MTRFVLAASVAALACAPISAAVVDVSYEGVITEGPTGVGTTLSGDFSYDTDSPDMGCPAVGCANYGYFNASITAVGQTANFGSATGDVPSKSIQIAGSTPSQYSFRIFSAGEFLLNLNTPKDSSSLIPLTLPNDLNLAMFNTSVLAFILPGYSQFFRGQLTALSSAPGVAAVPEPASWALMIAGFGLTGAGLRTPASRLIAV